MTEKISLLGRKTYKINDNVIINIPTVRLVRGENIQEENAFWNEISLFTTSPDDMVVELSDFGIDFSQIDEYELFVLLYSLQVEEKRKQETKELLFQNFNIWNLELKSNGEKYEFLDSSGNVVLDSVVYNTLTQILSFVTGHEKPKRKRFGTEQARKRWVEKERRKREIEKEKLNKRKESDRVSGGILDGMILRLVCNANFPYNFETINDITLFDLIYSLKQIEKDISVTDLMQSRLVGVDLSKISDKQLSRYVL